MNTEFDLRRVVLGSGEPDAHEGNAGKDMLVNLRSSEDAYGHRRQVRQKTKKFNLLIQ